MTEELPDGDTLMVKGEMWGGDQATTPKGTSYWRFIIYKYKGKAYVLENHLVKVGDDYDTKMVVKRLY